MVARANTYATTEQACAPSMQKIDGRRMPEAPSKIVQRNIRRLPITGAMAVLCGALRKDPCWAAWLTTMLACKPCVDVGPDVIDDRKTSYTSKTDA